MVKANGLEFHWGIPVQVRILPTRCLPKCQGEVPVTFFLAPSKHFLSLPASDKQAVGHIWSYKSVVPCGRTVVSSMHCGCSNPGSNLGQGSILLSGSRNMTLLFATSSYSWILCLKPHWSPVLPSCSQDSWPAADRSTRAKSWEVPTCNLFPCPSCLGCRKAAQDSSGASDTKSS